MAWFQRTPKTKEILESQGKQSLVGTNHAIWMHGDAPCMEDPQHASTADRRRDAAHRLASGRQYDIRLGLLVDAKRSWPGSEPGCRCTAKPVTSISAGKKGETR